MPENAARHLSSMFQRISIAITAEKDHLSELDGAIGDADHGITMALGFMAVNAELTKLDLERTLPSEVLRLPPPLFWMPSAPPPARSMRPHSERRRKPSSRTSPFRTLARLQSSKR